MSDDASVKGDENNHSLLVSIRRKVLSPFRFDDGTLIPTGSWACVPQRAIQCDPDYYSEAASFDGFRFATGKEGIDSCSPFTKTDTAFPFWGLGKRSWYVLFACLLLLLLFLSIIR